MADPQAKDAPYQVVARRFRPRAFDELVGQEAVQQSLRAALRQKSIPHAFLFAGSRGVGKTTTARILARCLNCANGPTPEPCGTCAPCRSILDGSNPDVIEIDAASNNSIDDVRALRERVGTAAMQSRYKVYVLDEAHMLSRPAWNAFLKTLEEPPPNVVFVMATTELHKVPDTIQSRCQVLHFQRIGERDIAARLRRIVETEGVRVADEVLEDLAVTSRGGMRDAETALERVLQLARERGGELDGAAYRELVQRVGFERAVEVAGALLAGDAATGLRFCDEVRQTGADEREAIGDVVEALRLCMLLQVDGPQSTLVAIDGPLRQRLQQIASGVALHRLEGAIQAGVLGRDRLRTTDDRAAVLELTVVRMAQAGALPSLGELFAAVRDGGGAFAATPVAGSGTGAAPSGGPAGAAANVAPGAAMGAAMGAAPATAGATGSLRGAVLAAFKDQALLAAALEQAEFEGPDAQQRVTVRLRTERKMYRDRLQAPGIQQQVAAVVQRVAGAPVQVTFAIQEAAAAAPPPQSAPPGPGAQRVLQKFGGRVVAVDPEDGLRSGRSGQPAHDEGADASVDAPPPADD